MGCAGSKLDDLEAVALCRQRSQLLAEAIEHRYALAEAHASYIRSLRSVGLSLHRFFLPVDGIPPSSPVLTLPPQRKGDPLPPLSPLYAVPSPFPPPPAIPDSGAAAAPEATHRHSHSNSGSHLQFLSSDDDDDGGTLHSDHSSPLHHQLHENGHEIAATTTTKTYYNFARKGPPASALTYEQRPFSNNLNPVQVGGVGDPSSEPSYPYYHGDPNIDQNQSYGSAGAYAYAYPYPYPPGYGVMAGEFFGSSPPPTMAPPPPSAASPSSSRAPPPPPSPPRPSTWDFLNPFEAYENYQQTYSPSRSSRELREEEGIPDLEEEEEEEEVVKEAYGDEKHVVGPSTSVAKDGDVHSTGKGVAMEDGRWTAGEEMRDQATTSGYTESEVRLTEKNVVVDEVLQRQAEGGLQRKVVPVPGSRSVRDAVHEIKTQFDRASSTCEGISNMLEVGKLPYHRRKYEAVSSKMRYAITPSLSTAATSLISTSKAREHPDDTALRHLDFDEEKGMKSGNLSSTMRKLYIWEKKLLEEVMAEEKMRLHHDRKSKRLRHLDDRGAEHHKIESTRGLVMKLSTKIKIAIQVVDSISNRIGKLRDEELWPQLRELIQGFVIMWQTMTECHRSQCLAVIESNNLDAEKLPDAAHLNATMHLGLELLNWIEIFSSWIDAQKCYVRSLNGWLMKCLSDEPEETADGIAPFSPGRLGAPPVFVICNHWSQAIDRISEREVIEAMRSLTTSVLEVWKQYYAESRHKMLASQETDRRLKALERNDQKIHKAVEALNKRQALVASQNGMHYAGQIIHSNKASEKGSLQRALQEIFEAIERFSESSMKAYEELGARCEEQNATI